MMVIHSGLIRFPQITDLISLISLVEEDLETIFRIFLPNIWYNMPLKHFISNRKPLDVFSQIK